MDKSVSLLKVGGPRGIRTQSHEIVFHVHRLGKTEASWEAEQSGCKKGDRGMWFIITHCALSFSRVSEDARQPGNSLESWPSMTIIEGEA
jgi:hypothetical protein